MRVKVVLFTVVAMMFVTVQSAWAAETLLDSVAKGCEKELITLCKDVTPGEGRILACIYAYSDKLSGQCEYALYDAAVQLERFVAGLSYVVNECGPDLDKFCTGVAVGKGRLLQCLGENASGISSRCSQALQDVADK